MQKSIKVKKSFAWDNAITQKVGAVMRMFGVSLEHLRKSPLVHECELTIGEGEVCFLTGASGSGKSVLLREIYRQFDETSAVWLDDIEIESQGTLIDCIEGNYVEGLRNLSKAGLKDVYCILTSPSQLSEGQKYRYKLAKALASGKRYIFADEFCSNLDRITAGVISYNIRKFAKMYGVSFFCASAHDDLMADLRPEVLVIKRLAGPADVIYQDTGGWIERENESLKSGGRWHGTGSVQCC